MKIKHFLTTLLVVLVLVTVSCKKAEEKTVAEEKTTMDLETAKKIVADANTVFAESLNKGDSIALANCYTTDAKFMIPNAKSVEGRPAIQTVVAGYINAGFTGFTLNSIDVWVGENTITAENQWSFKDKTGKILDEGKSMELYKMEDGKWKLYRDCYNSNLPCPK